MTPAPGEIPPWQDDSDRLRQQLILLLNGMSPDAVSGFLDNIAPALERMWAPRVLEQGRDVTALSTGQQVWAGPSRFNIFNFLDAASPVATWLGGNALVATGAASRSLSTLSAFPTAKMLLVCIFTGNNAVIDTSASSVTYNGVAMTQLGETNIVDAGEQLYGEVWYMANPPCEAAHNVVANFANVARTVDIGIGIYSGSANAPTMQTLSGIKATAPSMTVINVGETGMIEWAFGQRSAIGSTPTVQNLASANPTTTSFDSGVGGEAQIVQRRSTGNAAVAGQVSTTSAGTSAGMPWILFGISMPYGVGGGFSLAVDQDARNQVNIRSVPPSAPSGLVNVDYVVASDGTGTHLTLFGVTGALEAAIATGTSKVIWVCTTHVETRTTTHNLSGMLASQRVMVLSGSPYRANITFDFNGAAITQTGTNVDTSCRLLISNMQFTAAAGRTLDFYKAETVSPTGGAETPLELFSINFQTPGIWHYVMLAGVNGAAYSANHYYKLRGTFSAITATANTGTPTGDFVIDDCDLTLVNIVERGAAGQQDVGLDVIITNNRMTVTGYGYHSAGLLPARTYINDNRFLHNQTLAGGQEFIMWGTNSGGGFAGVSDVTVDGNFYNGANGGGNNTKFFWQARDVAGTVQGISVNGNMLHGPGVTSVAVQFDSATLGCSAVNGYDNWGTFVGGAGAPTVLGIEHHTLVATVDASIADTATPYQMVGPMAAAGTIFGVEAKANENKTVSGGTYIWDIHKILAANATTDGVGTTIFTTAGNRPTMTGVGAMRSTTTLPDVLAFGAGDYFAIYTDQSGTGLGTAAVGMRFTIP